MPRTSEQAKSILNNLTVCCLLPNSKFLCHQSSRYVPVPPPPPPLPRRVDVRCSSERKRCSTPPKVLSSPWLLLLSLCGDVETNPGPVCGQQRLHRRWDTNATANGSKTIRNTSLTVVHLNARSLLRHFDDVAALVSTHRPEVLAVSETWLDTLVGDGEIHIQFNSIQSLLECTAPNGARTQNVQCSTNIKTQA